MNASKWWVTAVLFFLLLTTACSDGNTITAPKVEGVTAVAYTQIEAATQTPTPSPTNTPSPTPTFTPTPSPTPTFTPTPRATPLTIVGDPRAVQLHDPIPQDGAVCGLVDVFDFPLDPPDAASITAGGRDFGVFRNRYDKYHAGEDWWIARGRSNFGQPVYSIGHGRVTYAEPLGWGRDQGVIIVRHTFTDGSTVLSFYGHLDPPSVTLRAGDCVTRGQQIGEIGRPRTAPHLHFEMRTHMPAEPGPGYWWEDPTKAGWLPPSQTIWTQRLMASAGVVWVQDPIAENTNTAYVGTVFGDIALTMDGMQLAGTTLSDGLTLPAFAEMENMAAVVLDTNGQTLYVADRLGNVDALLLTDPRSNADTAVLTPLWHTKLDVVGTPTLLPLPGGGLALLARGEAFAIAADGRLLWQQDAEGRPFAWTVTDDWLLLATTGSNRAVWATDGTQPFAQLTTLSGYPLLVGAQVWLYAENGVYRLSLDGQPSELLYALPTGFLDRGSIVALPDGGALLAHTDVFDQRLIAFNEDGTVRWQRSSAGLLLERQRLLRVQDAVYLTSFNAQGDVFVYAVDVETAVLTHIFTGGTRMPVMQNTWVVATADGRLLLNIGGGNRLLLDVRGAETAVAPSGLR